MRLAFCLVCLILLTSCSGMRNWSYQPKPYVSAKPTPSGHARPPMRAPSQVISAIHAGNQITGLPYKYGGGHASTFDSGYDCSGAVSRVLIGAGLLSGPRPSTGFFNYGNPGEGKWITVYATKGHSFIEVADLRFDTGWHGYREGPRWTAKSRPLGGYVARHPPGF